jgi:predicted nucleotidyltransferase component of viral defense system
MNNSASSIRARLLNLAKERQEDFNYILLRYALERLLFRVGISKYRERFILKGASLFIVWEEKAHRRTQDIDMLGYGDCTPDTLRNTFLEILQISCQDGIEYEASSLKTEIIKEHDDYQGVRLSLRAFLDRARIPVVVDVGTGDIITPFPENTRFPVLLETNKPPEILSYPVYTVIAEKLQTAITKGVLNSRMKDFYDLWYLSKTDLDSTILKNAVQTTFMHRQTKLTRDSIVFTEMFYCDSLKLKQWNAFITKNDLVAVSLEDAVKSAMKLVVLCI